MNRPVLILGCGGHGGVVLQALRHMGLTVSGFIDPAPDPDAGRLHGVPVLGDEAVALEMGPAAVQLANGVGGVARRGDPGLGARRRLFERFRAQGFAFPVVIGPGAIVTGSALLLEGAQVMAGAILQAGARIGMNAIVNSGAIVEHDCDVGAHSHVAPGAVLCGGVRVGEGAFIGAGATVIQGIEIGAGALVPAGAVVRRDLGAGETPGRRS